MDKDKEKDEAAAWPAGAGAERALLAISALATVLLLAWVVRFSRYGFDYTDEGLYLVWIARPFEYAASTTQFGFVYHPLYLLVGKSVAALRAAGFLISFALGTAAAWAMLRKAFGAGTLLPATRLAVAGAIGTLALLQAVFAGEWLPTPSYNSLALQGALATATGLCLADRTWAPASVAGWLLGGIGLCIAFLAKPTTGVALGVFAGACLLAGGQARLRQVLLAAATTAALLLLAAFEIDGSVGGFIQRHVEGLEMGKLLAAKSSDLLRLEWPAFDASFLRLALLLATALVAGLWLTQWRPRRAPAAGPLLGTALALGGIFASFRQIPAETVLGLHRNMLVLPLVGAVVLVAAVRLRWKGLRQVPRAQWALSVALFAFPYAYAFGSGNNYWVPMGSAAIMTVLAGLPVLGPLGRRVQASHLLLVLAIALQAVLWVVLQQAMTTPYRQPEPLAQHDTRVQVGSTDLLVSRADARYLAALQEAARQTGFRPGTPVIDLSGRSPGLLYALQARNIGLAWNLSGYPGTAAYVTRGLQAVRCEQLAAAWVLSQSAGPIPPVPAEVLASFGADLERDYRRVATTVSPTGQVQSLHQPARPTGDATRACADARGANG